MMQSRHLRPLTGIRGFAALAIVIYHYQWYFFEDEFFHFGYLGVDLFFILSGFILTHVHLYDDRILLYLQKRLARIYPVHLVTLIGLAAMVAVGSALGFHPDVPEQFSRAGFVSHLFLLQAWWPQPSTWNYPSWSVSCEWFVYLLFPVLVLAVRQLRSGLAIGLALVAVSSVFIWIFTTLFTIDVDNNSGAVSLSRVFFEFLLGMLLCRLWKMIRLVVPWLLLITGIGIFATQLGRGAAHDVAVVFCFAALILAGAYGGNWIAYVLGFRWAVSLGAISYSLYMVHVPVAMTAGKLVSALGARYALPGAVQLFGLASVAVITAAGMYRLVEVPARRRLLDLVEQRDDTESDSSAVARASPPA